MNSASTSPEFIRICSRAELPRDGECREFRLGARLICVANVNGEYVAMDNVCPHRGGSLGQGTVEHGFVVCPWHGWQFDPDTGVSKQDRHSKVDVYLLRLNGDDMLISAQPVR